MGPERRLSTLTKRHSTRNYRQKKGRKKSISDILMYLAAEKRREARETSSSSSSNGQSSPPTLPRPFTHTSETIVSRSRLAMFWLKEYCSSS